MDSLRRLLSPVPGRYRGAAGDPLAGAASRQAPPTPQAPEKTQGQREERWLHGEGTVCPPGHRGPGSGRQGRSTRSGQFDSKRRVRRCLKTNHQHARASGKIQRETLCLHQVRRLPRVHVPMCLCGQDARVCLAPLGPSAGAPDPVELRGAGAEPPS